MGNRMAKSNVERSHHERGGMKAQARPAGRPRSQRLMRGLACWLALQTALAAPLASAAEAIAAAMNGASAAPAGQAVAAQSQQGQGAPAARVATGVGSVPAPSPAVPYDPAAITQAQLATPTPALAASSVKALGIRTPTTAEPGTLVPGGRRQTLTFADLGARDPLQLRGTDGQNGVAFSVRGDEVVTGAILHLVYSYSPALLANISQLKVLVNGEVAATLPVPREQAGMLVARDVSIDPRFITEFNHLNVQLIGHYTTSCEDPANSSLWATVSNASSLDLTYASLASKPDLAALPQPFFDRRDVRRLELPFVFPQKPGAGTLEAGGIVASWFGALAGYRGAIFPAQLDNAPLSGNAVVFATDDQRPAGVTIPAISGPTIAVVDREAPARGKLLLVLGRTEAELKTAARALGIGQNTLTGPSATITSLNELAPRAPYDAPNWLPTNRPVRFGELADPRDLTVSGYDADAVRVNLRVPPDLFMWHTKGAPIDLRYRYTVRPLRDRSSLNISVNDGFVQSLPIPAESASVFELSHYFARVLPDKTAEARRTVHIPPLLLTPRAQVRLHFYYDIPNTGECHGRLLENVVGSIDPNSTIDLSSFPHYMALPDLAAFANSGFPFTRMADLSETAVVLPNDADSSDYSLYLLTMGRMGASTGYPVSGVTVGTADDVDKYANKDLLIFGAPGKQPLLQRWAKSMPFSSDGDSRTFSLSDVVFKLEDWWHGERGVERSPARADLTLVSSNGDALLTGFESPLQKNRSAVALVSAAGQSDADLSAALLDADVLPEIQGAMAVIHGRTVTITSNGEAYYVGRLSPQEYLRWALSSHPLLLVLSGVLAALIIAGLFYRTLRSIAARRLKD
ncbi:cellulose biosynthesis cyclic di-GMP-binding regulatory protein BcsB [Paraburkholderia fungorum]|uniref:cellulose biosynthesis cyclic di-GMP-binding regulatory protein BcsB n=1 Tax=Paraburkholderia fungorum TaxID=134537 RepID=UPI00209301F9|nr:cellulose biosynthesis cyclic di-GMP-binding regulatory protein BcsB [Paraburkholderia fungorum]USU19686.1 cellulose biosynthesis cyclic di-GMP-binding regulatory protein BcsB [Paraburkholderia fungorum]USU28318.1 cellulose biosynthesis cyclic di-GMP-binding regulatory protein BcsB [Paraburkholderia fungorum]